MNQEMIDLEKNATEPCQLPKVIFEVTVNKDLLHQVTTAQLAGRRHGCASTKTRSDVRGGGRKPWRQKGTGRARAGTIRSPIWVGGGVAFGPHPRDYSFSVPKKMKKAALKGALSLKVQDGDLLLIKEFNFDEPKTKKICQILDQLGIVGEKVLILTGDKNDNLYKSARNIKGVKVLPVAGLNIYDLLIYKKLIVTQQALTKIEVRLS